MTPQDLLLRSLRHLRSMWKDASLALWSSGVHPSLGLSLFGSLAREASQTLFLPPHAGSDWVTRSTLTRLISYHFISFLIKYLRATRSSKRSESAEALPKPFSSQLREFCSTYISFWLQDLYHLISSYINYIHYIIYKLYIIIYIEYVELS